VAEAVLDASALLAFLRNEPGAEEVAAVLKLSCISAVNLAETISKRNLAVLAEERGDPAEARRLWRMVLDACPGNAEAMSRGEA
jgi:uncharacterized protein with PIN domain